MPAPVMQTLQWRCSTWALAPGDNQQHEHAVHVHMLMPHILCPIMWCPTGALEPLAASVADAKRDLINEFDTWMARAGAATLMGVGGAGDEESELDAGEAFERMQVRGLRGVGILNAQV